jgi:hypothetical protein
LDLLCVGYATNRFQSNNNRFKLFLAPKTFAFAATVGDLLAILTMAGLGNNSVQVYRTCRDLHWEFLRLWAGFELSSSWSALPCYPN